MMTPLDRRAVLSGAALAAVAGPAVAEVQPAPALTLVEKLQARARADMRPLTFDGNQVGGPGWELICAEARGCEFVMLGEEHGLAELPLFARQLFLALRPEGFDTLGVEISPPTALELDAAARGGVEGIAGYVRAWPPGPAFYFWRTEAELIAAARAAVPGKRPCIWGVDYEMTGDRRLIRRLKLAAPASARPALAALERASEEAWATWASTRNPAALFTFSGDPALVRAVRQAWPHPDPASAQMLTTLEETVEINRLFPTDGWGSNERRSHLMRANLVAHLNAAQAEGRRPKVMFKMGETHMMRGVSTTGNFDLGSMIAEAAALRGGRSLSIIAGGGRGGRHGVLDPTRMQVADAPAEMLDGYMGLGFLTQVAAGPGPTVMDLRPLRRLISSESRLKALANPEAARAIFAYDLLLVWNGSTAARMLVGT